MVAKELVFTCRYTQLIEGPLSHTRANDNKTDQKQTNHFWLSHTGTGAGHFITRLHLLRQSCLVHPYLLKQWIWVKGSVCQLCTQILRLLSTPHPSRWVHGNSLPKVVDCRQLECSKIWISVVFSIAIGFFCTTEEYLRENRPCTWGISPLHLGVVVVVVVVPSSFACLP